MPHDIQAIQQARKARESGLFAVIGDSPTSELAPMAVLRATGSDAPSFLHSQLTNEVKALESGRGNLSARVTRTGHLVGIFSLHRLDDASSTHTYYMIGDATTLQKVREDLGHFLFADRVDLDMVTDQFVWVALQGGKLDAMASRILGDAPSGESWSDSRPNSAWRIPMDNEEALVFARTLTGDPGLIVGLPKKVAASIVGPSKQYAKHQGWLIADDGSTLWNAFNILRVEAGVVIVGEDTPSTGKSDEASSKGRLLPETGLEQQLVSYTKGCYLGQEVIARVRTYGALPFAMRGLVIKVPPSDRPSESVLDSALNALDSLPSSGEELFAPDGSKIGQIVSRAYSPVLEAPIAFAYLHKKSRTPSSSLTFQGKGRAIEATVVLLPFYQVADRDARVAFLYDKAIKTFAQGKEEDALQILEEVLRFNPSFADAYEAIGVILGRSGHYHEAIDLFRRLEEVAPSEPMVNTNLSLYYMKIGDKETAEKHSAVATQKSMEFAFQKTAGGGARSTSDIEEEQEEARRVDAIRKIDIFRQVLDIDPEDPVALFGLGNAHATLKEWEEAEAIYAVACESQKNNAAIFLARGKTLEALGRHDDALIVYRDGMDVASRKGDLMPLKEMQNRASLLSVLKKK